MLPKGGDVTSGSVREYVDALRERYRRAGKRENAATMTSMNSTQSIARRRVGMRRRGKAAGKRSRGTGGVAVIMGSCF